MDSSDKDGLSTDAVHVDAGASLNVIEVHVAKLGDEVDYIILGTHLEQREEGRQREEGEGKWGKPEKDKERGRREKRKRKERGERDEGRKKGRGERETKEGRKGEGNQRENLKDITPPLKAVKWHTNLHGYGEVSLSLWREEDIHCFLLEGLVALRRGPHFNDMQL